MKETNRPRRILTAEQVKKRLTQENGPDLLMKNANEALDAALELYREGFAPAAAFLWRCARRKEYAARIEEFLGEDRAALHRGLKGASPKLRQQSARLVSYIGRPADLSPLTEALDKEDTRFVRPAMLLAIGAIGGDKAKAYLEGYRVSPAATPEEQPHVKEEQYALSTALKSFLTFESHTFTKLPQPVEVVLIAPDKLADGLAREITDLGYRVAAVHQSSVRVHTDDIAGLFRARSFTEALIEISANCNPNLKGVAIKAKGYMEKLLPACHEGNPPFGYRIELRGGQLNRAQLAKELAGYMDGDIIQNSPSSYEAELRIEHRSNGSANIYLKLLTVPDTRFDYRLGALPASMHPATAAAVLRYAENYLSKDARVLDICCGSGTFLIEREKLMPCAALTGIDIAHSAIDIARKNAEAAGSKAKFIVNDCLRFEADRPYDELIANLPFGNRVSSHKNNAALYAGILDNLPKWVKKGGIAILYTMEYTLLKKQLRDRPGLKLITEVRTEAGGLMPTVFVVKV